MGDDTNGGNGQTQKPNPLAKSVQNQGEVFGVKLPQVKAEGIIVPGEQKVLGEPRVNDAMETALGNAIAMGLKNNAFEKVNASKMLASLSLVGGPKTIHNAAELIFTINSPTEMDYANFARQFNKDPEQSATMFEQNYFAYFGIYANSNSISNLIAVNQGHIKVIAALGSTNSASAARVMHKIYTEIMQEMDKNSYLRGNYQDRVTELRSSSVIGLARSLSKMECVEAFEALGTIAPVDKESSKALLESIAEAIEKQNK